MPGYTVCAVHGCPELTRGNYCPAHVEMTEAEEAAEIRRLEELRADGLADLNDDEEDRP